MREEEALIMVGLFFLFIILVKYVVNVRCRPGRVDTRADSPR